MSLIDASYFNFEVNTPVNKYNNLQDFINRFEPEILKKLLGLDLYRKVTDPENAAYATQEIIDLREGVDYSVDGVLYRWNGLINEEKISLISYYVFYWFIRLNLSETSSNGEVQISLENASIANVSLKLQDIWDRLENLYGSICNPKNYQSAYKFLNEFSDDYPTWEFQEIGNVNAFDL